MPIHSTLNNTGFREREYSFHFQVECYEIFIKHFNIFNEGVKTFGITILQEHGERNYLWDTEEKTRKKNKNGSVNLGK